MSWLKRMFGMEKPQNPEQAMSGQAAPQAAANAPAGETIAPERIGLNGEYDQSGLAKRVALAFDQDPQVADCDTVWVAQTGSTVVLKGKAPSQDTLNRLTQIANNINGASAVDTNQVEIG
ncbi:BON domain-containing protein [Myxacorys almedinensis]|uniref:Phospholipid-binding protein n=1 Tax=Myxacorys almedinensis A TaxID=2690445 RepID=A0A8J7YY33_9CYAN|nr:BON domain-containing protein [Myxacorys almedinensis]NDJ16679.1 phospholipid-binding protein [Myxacorys almedinensis A]